MSIRPVYLAHELDAAWIIALWLAIHGGDPSPEVIAARAIAALAQYVNGTAQQAFTFEELKTQFGKLGVTVTERAKQEAQSVKPQLQVVEEGEPRIHIHQYCFKFEGATICTELPVLTHLRTAA
ncbi:MAG TPA: hypothetical protein VE377_14685 [Candidatus Dormibacteraeota bacterium]|nr:hypothetical protein [Candidatus Dormibacteraeota bacterium]